MMGPIEAKIRAFGKNAQLDPVAEHVIRKAAENLGFRDMLDAYTTGPAGHVEDVLSEAIEAASELGL